MAGAGKEQTVRVSTILIPLAALALAPSALQAEDGQGTAAPAAEQSTRDYIAFPNRGGVRDWRAIDSDTIYFQDRRKQWYKASLSRPAHDLPYTLFVGIDESGGGRLDKWSSIYVRGERYMLSSFEKIDGQPPKRRKSKDKDGD